MGRLLPVGFQAVQLVEPPLARADFLSAAHQPAATSRRFVQSGLKGSNAKNRASTRETLTAHEGLAKFNMSGSAKTSQGKQLSKLLVSACLLGRPVRYDGRAKTLHDDWLSHWIAEGRVVPLCPELLAGLPTPRPPAEILGGDGDDVLKETARIIEANGNDVSAVYRDGAHAALKVALAENCRFALLTDGSPTCGSGFIYDGQFSGQRRPGHGVAAALLRDHDIAVFAPDDITALAEALAAADSHDDEKL